MRTIETISDYIGQFPESTQLKLLEIYQIIKQNAPTAIEKISYQMPTFYLNGNLVHFAAYKNHIGFYPTPSGIEKFQEKLSKYKNSKGAVQFKLNEEIPKDLIKEIVKYRVNENEKRKVGIFITKEIENYIKNQPEERQYYLRTIYQIITKNIPNGFEETIQYNMITFVVPHKIYEKGYHVNPGDPLPFISLANQKKFISLYHLGIYSEPKLLDWFTTEYEKLNIGKLDIGKSCIRFKNMSKIPYELIAELCKKISVAEYIKIYESNLKNRWIFICFNLDYWNFNRHINRAIKKLANIL